MIRTRAAVPGPVPNAASATPSPLKSATTDRIAPANPGNGWNLDPAAVRVPSAPRENPWADPSAAPVMVTSPHSPQVQPFPCWFGGTETVDPSGSVVGL